MTDKLFDSFIKEKLEHYPSQVPEGLWEKIMPEEKRKPKIFWWWNKTAMLVAIALLVTIGSATYFGTNNKLNIANNEFKNSTSLPQNEITKADAQQKNDVATTTLNTYHSNDKTEHNAVENKSINSKTNNENITIKKESIIIENDPTTENNVAFKNKKNNPSKLNLLLNAENKNNTTTNDNNTFSLIPHHHTTKNKGIKNSNHQLNTATTLNRFASIKNNAFAKENLLDKYLINNDDVATTQTNKLGFSIDANTTDLLKLSNNAAINLKNLFARNDDCPSAKGVIRNDFYIEAYASPDFTFKKTISTTTGLEKYLTKKDSVEVLRGGFTVGARFSKSITNNLLLKAGLQYSQVNENFALKTENERRQTIVINSHTITRPGQGDTTISDTSVYIQIGYRVQSNMNYYRNFELPVMISYEVGEPDSKWKFGFNGGAIINLTSWYEGRTIDIDNKLINIGKTENNAFYKQQIGISLYGSIALIRNISNTIDVFVEPYYRLGISKMKSYQGFNQTFNAVGLRVGARIKLNKNKHL